MADLNDISASIASALTEVGVNGHLDVEMDGAKQAAALGRLGDEVEVEVIVRPVEHLAA